MSGLEFSPAQEMVIDRALERAYNRGLEDAAKVADVLTNSQELKLRAGEMKAQEERTAIAVAGAIAAAIRALKQKDGASG